MSIATGPELESALMYDKSRVWTGRHRHSGPPWHKARKCLHPNQLDDLSVAAWNLLR